MYASYLLCFQRECPEMGFLQFLRFIFALETPAAGVIDFNVGSTGDVNPHELRLIRAGHHLWRLRGQKGTPVSERRALGSFRPHELRLPSPNHHLWRLRGSKGLRRALEEAFRDYLEG